MRLKELLERMIPQFMKLSKTETKILEAIVIVKSGNAYGLWKKSGLKHYPTVLRSLKKLEEKRLLQILSESGTRGERTYTPTSLGTLIHYALKDEKAQLIETVSRNSYMFQELVNSKVIEDAYSWMYNIIRRMASDVVRGELRTIDYVVKEAISEYIGDTLLNIRDQENKNEIIKLSKVESVKELIIDEIEEEIGRCQKQVQELRKLKERLTAK